MTDNFRAGSNLISRLPRRYRLDPDGPNVIIVRQDQVEEINIGTLTPIRKVVGSYLALLNAANGHELADFDHPKVVVTQSSDGTIEIELDTGGMLIPHEITSSSGEPIRYMFGELGWLAIDEENPA